MKLASQEILIGFMKFTTGSSTLHPDNKADKIKVRFMNRATNLFPIAHTCFKTFESPKYRSLDVMKQKYDIAFTLGVEGFGFV